MRRAPPFDEGAFVRVITQALREMGYPHAAAELVRESRIPEEAPGVAALRAHVLAGEWAAAEELLGSLGVAGAAQRRCRFAMRVQKFAELLSAGEVAAALVCLQEELTPLGDDEAALHAMAVQLVTRGLPDGPGGAPGVAGANAVGRAAVLQKVLGALPPAVLLPPHRLETLVSQALQLQMSRCARYNRTEEWQDLLSDCHAEGPLVPTETYHVLDAHSDEVGPLGVIPTRSAR